MNRRVFGLSLLATSAAVPINRFAFAFGSQPQLRVNGARLNQHLKELSEFGKNPQGGVSRVAYTEAKAMFIQRVMAEAKSCL